jgi:restriction system protein
VAQRGIIAEILYQNQKAARKKQQAATAAAKRNLTAQRQLQQAAIRLQRADAQLQRATAANQKHAELEAKKMHVEAMEAEATAKNAELDEYNEMLESLLADSLSAPISIDLDSLKTKAEHPPFSDPEFESPLPPLELITAAPEPEYQEPPSPKGFGAAFGGKKRHAEEVAAATASFNEAHLKWKEETAKIPSIQLSQMQAHQRFEEERLAKLDTARKQYEVECEERENAAREANKEIDNLIAGISRSDKDALQTYVSIVLENFPYPEGFLVEHEYSFEPELKELNLTVAIPGPSSLSTIREYKFNKAKDEIIEVTATQKQLKDRYATVVYSVALRSLHEIFEADEAGHIQTIALSVNTNDIDPATGKMERVALLSVAVDRDSFQSYDLSKVVPLATLQHMKALISKSPFDLIPIDQSRGVRNRGA